MNAFKNHWLTLEIVNTDELLCLLKIINENGESAEVYYTRIDRDLEVKGASEFVSFLNKNSDQLRKILINKKEETFYEGFKLEFVIIENKPVTSYEDRNKTIVLDRRGGEYFFKLKDSSNDKLIEAYTDGSYSTKTRKGGFVVLLKDLNGDYKLRKYKSKAEKSSLLELQAAIKALELLKDNERFRIITDSVYVIKGITEWLPMWKLNQWITCNGEVVKNIYHWEKADALTENKYIEFKWVKGHSGHFENSICDLYAKEIAGK